MVISKYVSKIKFGLVSPSVTKKMGVVNIITPEIYDSDGYPVEKGLMDPAMGVIDPGLSCRTCGGRMKNCSGHFGYINLSKPVIHILYKDHIYDFIRATCKSCGHVPLPESKKQAFLEKIETARNDLEQSALQKQVRDFVKSVANVKKCHNCNEAREKVKFNKPQTYMYGDERLWPNDLLEWLEKIPDEDVKLFGMTSENARPEWMILTTLMVPPITMRPSITLETGERSEDDLTHKLSDVVRVNQRLLENVNAGAPEIIVEDLWDLLQYHVTTYFNNEISGVPPARHRTRRQLKTLSQRLKGKQGIFRQNLSGKRVNFCARSVISPDAHINVNEVGVPKNIAYELTVPETVTEWNIDWIKNMLNNIGNYPSISYVTTNENRRKKVTKDTLPLILEELTPGYVVDRNLINGDIVLFNRQPSLHRMSMMAHRVKVVPGETLRINPAVCLPYNADFDGDEMNLHVPQTIEARAEAESILLLDNQVVTPRYGLSIIGAIEDSILGIYYLTKDMMLTKQQASDLALSCGIDKDLPSANKEGLISGKDIFSMLLPDDFEFIKKGKVLSKGKVEKGEIKISKGKLIDGIIDSSFIGPEGGFIIHKLFLDYDQDHAIDFLNKVIHMGLHVAQKIGFTVSFNDFDIKDSDKNKIQKILEETLKESEELEKLYRSNKIEPYPGITVFETFETKMQALLSKARSKLGDMLTKNADQESHLVNSAQAGAGDKMTNLVLMNGFIGQTSLRGSRINFGYTDRTLPHFNKDDLGPEAHGFIKENYAKGIDATEVFFQAIAGRDSFMDTAMRTPKSGYLQRRLTNSLQDLKVAYDGTVRDGAKKIIQFSYGGDGVDVSKSDGGHIVNE